MKRLLLDTNIYGLLTVDDDFHTLHTIMEQKKDLWSIYGYALIRRELKAAPRLIEDFPLRASLLRTYSSFIIKEYPLSEEYEVIAQEYYNLYREAGGKLPLAVLHNDFLIVACASKHGIPIVVSEDNSTLLSELTLAAYKKVNVSRNLAVPVFIGYIRFKEMLMGATFTDPFIDGANKFGIFLSFFYICKDIFLFLFHMMVKEKLIYKSFVIE